MKNYVTRNLYLLLYPFMSVYGCYSKQNCVSLFRSIKILLRLTSKILKINAG